MRVKKNKKRMVIRGQTISLKIRHIKDIERLRASKEVKLELILPA